MKIAVIGAGWYGCHISAKILQSSHEVTLFEKEDKIFNGASKRNQNRLHLGFHYPRDYLTRSQSSGGYDWFKEHYANLIENVPNNYYAIASRSSLLDFETYLQIMNSQKLKYQEVKNPIIKLNNIDGCISVDEMLIRSDLASEYFESLLGKVIRLNSHIDLNNKTIRKKLCLEFDLVIDCTWMTSRKNPSLDIFYEPCIYFYYKKNRKDKFAITIMDGNFISLYPFKDDVYTLTSVEHTPVGNMTKYEQATKCIEKYNDGYFISHRRKNFEDLTCLYYPRFLDDFEYIGHEFGIKSKMKSGTDFRGTIVFEEDNLVTVFSGKIDTIHIAEKKIMEYI